MVTWLQTAITHNSIVSRHLRCIKKLQKLYLVDIFASSILKRLRSTGIKPRVYLSYITNTLPMEVHPIPTFFCSLSFIRHSPCHKHLFNFNSRTLKKVFTLNVSFSFSNLLNTDLKITWVCFPETIPAILKISNREKKTKQKTKNTSNRFLLTFAVSELGLTNINDTYQKEIVSFDAVLKLFRYIMSLSISTWPNWRSHRCHHLSRMTYLVT